MTVATDKRAAGPVFTEAEYKRARIMAVEVSREFSSTTINDESETPSPIPDERLALQSAGIRYLSHIVTQLNELMEEDEQDGYGILRPKHCAYEAACQILIDAAIVSAGKKLQIPYGCASSDPTGGIRIEWVRDAASVHLIVPADSRQLGYVYFETGDKYSTMPATAESLSRCLQNIT